MLHIYLKTALRHLLRNRLNSVIVITGLVIGFAASVSGIMYVYDEFNFDQFHENKNELYRIVTHVKSSSDKTYTMASTGQVQGPAFEKEIPGIKAANRIMTISDLNLIGEENSFAVDVAYTDANFFELYTFPLVQGNPATALKEPHSVVITEKIAKKFFGSENALGKLLKIEEGRGMENLKITGVIKTPPANSSIQFEAIIPFSYMELMFKDDYWLNQYLTTFVKVEPTASVQQIETSMTRVFARRAAPQLQENRQSASNYSFQLQPLRQVHLGELRDSLGNGSSRTYSYILMGIVLFILLMGCVNFINLSIAGSIKRSKEIGVRKISGGTKYQIMSQFFVEASLLCIVALLLGIALVAIWLPIFNNLTGKSLTLLTLLDPEVILSIIAIFVVCVIGAALYPALALAAFDPKQVLYSRQKLNLRQLYGRAIMILQFSIAITLMVATIIYKRQMNFLSNNDPGYDATNVVRIHLPPQRITPRLINTFRNELLSSPGIAAVATTSEVGDYDFDVTINQRNFVLKTLLVNESYLSVLKIPLVDGRNFSAGMATDSNNSVIVNEAFVHQSGIKDPLGSQVIVTDDKRPRKIIGVTKNHHYESFKKTVQPLAMLMGNHEYVLIRLHAARLPAALASVETTYRKLMPDHYYHFSFLQDDRAAAYRDDKRWQQIINVASVLAILICCLGLYGLANFMTQQRAKEISIRKVIGASVFNIVKLLSGRFMFPVLFAILIAIPASAYIMSQWLQNFAYRIELSAWDFILAGSATLLIALVTVSTRTFNEAIANPVKGLRSE